jgi:hypothetical protein
VPLRCISYRTELRELPSGRRTSSFTTFIFYPHRHPLYIKSIRSLIVPVHATICISAERLRNWPIFLTNYHFHTHTMADADHGFTRNASINTADFSPDDIITRDVCIIGGGASGTYRAIQLHDQGKSVIIVEQKSVLGGQTATYTDPASGNRTEMGVVAWYNNDIVNKFFARLAVPLKTVQISRAGFTTLTSTPVDFRTGDRVTNLYSGNFAEGFKNYAEQLAKYPYLEDGFDIRYPIPSDLLPPFGEFVEKYNIRGAMPLLTIFGNGMGDLLKQPTLYVFKLISLETLQALQAESFQSTLNQNNHELYEKAQAELGHNVLLNARVLTVDRSGHHPTVVVQTPSGPKLIKAKKLLLAIPPKLENLSGFDLDSHERSLFTQFGNTGWFSGVLKNTGIPSNTEVRNFSSDTVYNLPVLPGIYMIQPVIFQTSSVSNIAVCNLSPSQLSNKKSWMQFRGSTRRPRNLLNFMLICLLS